MTPKALPVLVLGVPTLAPLPGRWPGSRLLGDTSSFSERVVEPAALVAVIGM